MCAPPNVVQESAQSVVHSSQARLVPGCVLRDLWDQEEEQDAEDIVMDMAAVGWYIQNI